ncbi:MAG: HD domain-containing protein [Lachnospiraceae bacterium]|nr:HD domain-containing protein [Lachnospiraceae bacterium]
MEERKNNLVRVILLCFFGMILNMILSYLTDHSNIPCYFDVIGTILVSFLGGYIPGIVVSLVTNSIKALTYTNSIYYGVLHVMIASLTVYLKRKGVLKKVWGIILYTFLLACIGAGLGNFIYWFFEGYTPDGKYGPLIVFFAEKCGMGQFAGQYVGMFLYDLLDKTISVGAMLLLLLLFPKAKRDLYLFTGWRQDPEAAMEAVDRNAGKVRRLSLRTRIIVVLIFASLASAATAMGIGMALFSKFSQQSQLTMASTITYTMNGALDEERMSELFIKHSRGQLDAKYFKDYAETREMVQGISESAPDVRRLYVFKPLADEMDVLFCSRNSENDNYMFGRVDYDPSMEKMIPELLKGERIDPIRGTDGNQKYLTVFEPVFDEDGALICYYVEEMDLSNQQKYETDYLVKELCLFVGAFILILAVGFWIIKYKILYPINSISSVAGSFSYASEAERQSNLDRIRALKITTGDEVERLYQAVEKNTEDSIENFKLLLKKTESMNNLQSGLIMVLADMVENRDESTGDHIQKTAAYVQLILEEMKKKGLYPEKLTDQYIKNVVRSAPLHDIGKIGISDTILNKPGRFTDEEYEIMKTHALIGEKIMKETIATLPEADYLQEAMEMAGGHHEKWNGQGYPRGLKEEEIPLSARVMAVADVFDALVSKRCYKEPYPIEKALDIIRKDAGTHFDPQVAEAFLGAEEQVRKIAETFEDRIRKVAESAEEE